MFLPYYRQLLPDAYYLIIVRDYQSTVSSLINRSYKAAKEKYLSKSLLSWLLWKQNRSYPSKEELYETFGELYLKVWIAYNQAILQHISLLPPDSCFVVGYEILNENDKLVFTYLKDNWKFALHYFDFKNVYKQSMISEAVNLEPYIKQKHLLADAHIIESKFKSYFLNGVKQL